MDKLTPEQIKNWRRAMGLSEIVISDEDIEKMREKMQKMVDEIKE